MRKAKTWTERERRKQLEALSVLPDDRIDISDIPELTAEQMQRAVRGQWYRPLKKPVTIRLDMDVIEWLKKEGPGYQTKANRLLRAEMLRSLGRKSVQNETGVRERGQAKKKRAR
jgi:uncharacterized protein (DUF4415 family)